MRRAIGRVEVLPDPTALARHVAEWMTAAARASEGPLRVSLSGGSTPKTLFGLLASEEYRRDFPWPRVSWYWGDERFVPYDHPDSNYRMAREAMLDRAPVPPGNVHPIQTDGGPDDAARRYERIVQVGTQNRSAHYNMLAKEYIDSGKLGSIHYVKVFNEKEWPNYPVVADG